MLTGKQNYWFVLVLLLFNCSKAAAQKQLPKSFSAALEHGQLEFFEPLENEFKIVRTEKNPLLRPHMTIRSRRQAVEIRYFITAAGTKAFLPGVAHINCMKMAAYLATNSEEALIALHPIPAAELSEFFHADWGASVYFQPKESFSRRNHCKMISLFAAGKGQAYIFFLFDEANEMIDQQKYTLRFSEKNPF